jgi:hypothetical protein
MGEVRINYDDDWMDSVQSFYPSKKAKPRPGAIIREALGLYRWALAQRKEGRFIVSMNQDMSDPARLLMPSIEEVAPPDQQQAAAAVGQAIIRQLQATS